MADPRETECFSAFIQHGYPECVKTGLDLLSTGGTDMVTQLTVISLQRMGRTTEAEQLGTDALAALASFPWEQLLMSLTLGKATIEDVLPQAVDEKQRCAAHFYAGARLMTLGMLSTGLPGHGSVAQDYLWAACAEFDACSATESECVEKLLARALRSSLHIQ